MIKMLYLFFIFSTIAISKEEVSLDNLLDQLNNVFYQRQIFENTKEANSIKKDTLKLRDYNGIQTSYDMIHRDKNSDVFESLGEVKYGNFYVKGSRNKKDSNKVGFGVEKNLKDLAYSKYDSDLKKLSYEENKDEVIYLKKLRQEKISLINVYRDIKNVESEVSIKNSALKVLNEQREILGRSVKLGKTSKVDLESLLYNRENTLLEINYLKEQLLTLKEQFFYKYNINISKVKLKNIDSYSSLDKLKLKKIDYLDLKELELERNILEETVKYQKYSNKVPDITLGFEKQDENKIMLKFSKKLFYEDLELVNNKNDLKEKTVLVNQKQNDLESTKYEIKNDIFNLEKEILMLKNQQYIDEKIYNVKLLENKLGRNKYIDVIEAFDKYIKTSTTLSKEINKLNAYIYIVKVRGEDI